MNKVFQFINLIFLSFLLGHFANGQSAVYVYKDVETGKGDYVFVYGMPSVAVAEDTAKSRIAAQGYQMENIQKYASTESKGHGLIIRSVFPSKVEPNKKPVLMVVYGAAIGCESYEDAEKKSIENMKEFNPEWDPEKYSYKVIQRFYDEPEAAAKN